LTHKIRVVNSACGVERQFNYAISKVSKLFDCLAGNAELSIFHSYTQSLYKHYSMYTHINIKFIQSK